MTISLLCAAFWGGLTLAAVGTDTAETKPDTVIVLDSIVAEQAVSCRVEIETISVETGAVEDTLDILIDAHGVAPAGCMLKVGLDGSQVGIVDILPGEIVDSCRWEMFSAGPVLSLDPGNRPRELWQITALAQTLTDSASPPCLKFDRPASIARIVVSSRHLPSVPDTTVGVFFYWEDCRDNGLSDSDGRSILISNTVSSSMPEVYRTDSVGFPTRYGAPAACVSPRAYIKPRRITDFVSGGVEFRFKLAPNVDSSQN